MWINKKENPSSDARPAFIKTAEAFCAHIEGAGGSDRTNFVRVCFLLVSKLLSEALELPEGRGTSGGQPISEERHSEIAATLEGLLGEDDYYTMMFNPYEIAAEPVVGSVADDLADLWFDVKSGLEALQQGQMESAIVRWRTSFTNQWADQATQVLRPLTTLLLRAMRNSDTAGPGG